MTTPSAAMSSSSRSTQFPEFAGSGKGGMPGRPALHPLEVTVVVLTSVHLCFLPWAFGTVDVWSQLMSIGFSLVGFALVLLPRARVRGFSNDPVVITRPIARLWRFPVFWAGLVLLGYVAVQGGNPAWRFVSNDSAWWLEPIRAVAGLPAGVDAPFSRSNPWRALVVGASLWLLVCTVWAGFSRRRSYLVLFTVLAGNAFLVAVLGVLQKLSGTGRIFWSFPPANDSFMASFIYPNHAGPYLYLGAALCFGLAWRHSQRAHRGLEKIWPARLWTLAAVIIGAAVVLSYSRTSILMLFVFVAVVGGILVARRFWPGKSGGDHREFLPLGLLLVGTLGFGLVSLRSEQVWKKFAPLAANPTAVAQDRAIANRASVDMLRDRWVLGWGAGCFRHGFPLYAQNYPAIYLSATHGLKYWEHAHNDLLEFPIELGVVGMLPVVAMLLWGAGRFYRRRGWTNPVSLAVALGCVLVFMHSGVDFVFQNPAVLFTWGVLFVSLSRWAELDTAGDYRPGLPSAPR